MPPSPRAARTLRRSFWPAVALVVLGLVGQASYAAFSDTTSNAGNSLAAGTVALADDDSGSALLALTNLKPGSSGSRCIAVTSSGTLPASVKLYATSAATTKNLSTYIDLVVTQGTGATFSSCSGFAALSSGSSVYNGSLASFTSSATGYGNGVGSWTPTGRGSETRVFQVAYAVSTGTPDTAQGGTASFGLTWETQNT